MSVLEALKKDSKGRLITSRAAKLAVQNAITAKTWKQKLHEYFERPVDVEPLPEQTFAERIADTGISFYPPGQAQ